MQKEIIKELAGYGKLIRRMGKDQRLLATHISLFTAMFVAWQQNGYTSPLR